MNRLCDLHLCLNCHIPFASFKAHSHILLRTKHITTLAIAYPADFRQKHTSVAIIHTESLRISEGVVYPLFLEFRKTRSLGKEIPVGLVEILECLLQDLRWCFGQE